MRRGRVVAIAVVTVLLVADAASGGLALNHKHQVEQQRTDLAAARAATAQGDCAAANARLDDVGSGPLVALRQRVPKIRQPCLDWAAADRAAAAAKPADAVMTYLRYLRDEPPARLAERARAAAARVMGSAAVLKSATAELCRYRPELAQARIADVTGHDERSRQFYLACMTAEIGLDPAAAVNDYTALEKLSPAPVQLKNLLPGVGLAWVKSLPTAGTRKKLEPYQSVAGLHGRARVRIQYLGRRHLSALFVGPGTALIEAKPCTSCRLIKSGQDTQQECKHSKAEQHVLTLPAGDYHLIELVPTDSGLFDHERWKLRAGQEYWYCFP